MKKNLVKNKSAVSIAIVAVIVIIVVVAIVAGAYYYTTTQKPNPNASPTPTPTATASPVESASPTVAPSTSPSPTPQPTAMPIANFRAGAYANYTITTYDATTGNETSSLPFYWTIADGNTVWVLTESTTVISQNMTIESSLIFNVDKTTLHLISGRLLSTSAGVVITNQTIDLSSPVYNTTGSEIIDPSLIIGQESITVPAGTFNCEKATTTDATTGAVTNVWINSNIPAWGIVKLTTTQGSVVTSLTELTAYG